MCLYLTFIHSFYHQIVCAPCIVNFQKSERSVRKQKNLTVLKITKMKKQINILPAGFESDEDYDEFGDYIEKVTYDIKPQEEDLQVTLYQSCISNNVPEIIRVLNSGSVNINCYLYNSWTPLMHAAFNGSKDAVKCLLENGADPLVQYDCHNVVMCVCNCKTLCNETDLLDCLKLLARFDIIDINAKDRAGFTALIYACSNGWLKIVDFLINHGADIEIKDNQRGETALFFAVRSNNINIVNLLLSCGANKNAIDKKSETVYRIAQNKNMINILMMLNTDYNNVQPKDYFLVEKTYWDVIMTELENGFSQDVRDFLECLSMNIYIDQIISNNTTFKYLLTRNEDQFVDLGTMLSPHRKLLATALKTFHLWNWNSRSSSLHKKNINMENIAQTLASIVRHLHILDASITYLGNHSYGLNSKKGQVALNHLKSIKIIEDNIFKILDKRMRVSRVDYIGPTILKIQNKKIKIMDKVCISTIVILVLLRIV